MNDKKLIDEELEKVTGVFFDYEKYPDKPLPIGGTVVDKAGVQYLVLYFDEAGSDDNTKWCGAKVTYMPESAKSSTYANVDGIHFVNSSMVEVL